MRRKSASVVNQYCYGPSVISIIVTKRGPPGSSGLYKTSGTMGWRVAESRS